MGGWTPHGRKQPSRGYLGGVAWQEVHGPEQPFLPGSESTLLRKYFTSLTSARICKICLPAELGRIRPSASDRLDTTDTQPGDKRKTPQ